MAKSDFEDCDVLEIRTRTEARKYGGRAGQHVIVVPFTGVRGEGGQQLSPVFDTYEQALAHIKSQK